MTAFEMARRLSQRGHEVASVVLFGTSSPAALRPVNRARAALEGWIADRKRGARRFASLSGRERVEFLRSKALQVKPSSSPGDERAERRASVERATVAAAHEYRPGVYAGRIALFIPNKATVRSADRPLEWRAHAVDTDVFFGPDTCDGDTMLKAPGVETIARHLSGYLCRDERVAEPVNGARTC
jgi:thioesterase domain-containing protein